MMSLRLAQWLAPTLLLMCLCLPTQGCRKTDKEAPAPVVIVQVAHPKFGSISEEIIGDAILAPVSEAALSPRISAPIRAEYVRRGDHVHRGELLLTLDDRDLRGNALDSQGVYASAQANYTATTNATIPEELTKARLDTAQLKTALAVAQTTAAERRKLFQQGALSGHDVDVAVAAEAQATAAYETARSHADILAKTTGATGKQAAQGQLTSARGKLENAEAQAGYADLRSPIDGIVTERPLFAGETTTAGTPAITIMDTSSLLAKLHLSQAAAQELTPGRAASVSVPGIPDPVDAAVSFIAPALDPGSTTVEVWLKLPNANGQFKVGTPVHVVIRGRTVNDALQVPAGAVLPGRDSGIAVMVVASDGTAHKRAVQPGIRTAVAVQVLSGLAASDTVITEGGYGLDDGTKVEAGEPAGPSDDGKAGR